jgi:hypothetical protein
MTDEFTIESITARTIIVRHVAHDHRYALYVMGEPRRRLLCVGPVQTGGKKYVDVIPVVREIDALPCPFEKSR